jgi:hypothetical protein
MIANVRRFAISAGNSGVDMTAQSTVCADAAQPLEAIPEAAEPGSTNAFAGHAAARGAASGRAVPAREPTRALMTRRWDGDRSTQTTSSVGAT